MARKQTISAPSHFTSILVAVTGMSPAILTETIWALAQEKPRCLPAKVVVFGTTRSRDQIRTALLESGVWEELRRALKAGPDELVFGDTGEHIRVFTRRGKELDDLTSEEDNTAAADFILENLRQFTENPEIRIQASIAGGRKTMGALLYAAMTLLGRETDRVTHVLASAELEKRRDFYFPKNKKEANAVTLAEVPFVPLRNAFHDLGRMPGNFRSLVAHYTRKLRSEKPPTVRQTDSGFEVDGTPVHLTPRARLVLQYLIELNGPGAPIPQQSDIGESFKAFLDSSGDTTGWSKNFVSDDVKRALSEIRKNLKRAGIPSWGPGLRRESLKLPPFKRTD